MYLLGEKAWWLLAGIAKILPDVDLEGTRVRKPTDDSRTSELVHKDPGTLRGAGEDSFL
ncbi:hypothetical protein StoSoilB3_00330 [Arthrobacter sp. StoSoilB3]|jgi:RND superfamily putative drug exporter|nr:hypothetical protein [Paenarthrobacter nicotinovorans]BCW38498.1 hypothetical protein StoSoilB3_00330 [Arthrobacter sp. StoSoilB3]MBP2394535.1 hypothetical protein [Paenarthrobacter nicotinovorans]UKE99279.1 hypothetical protein LU808_00180 [Paenarthrobacter nicotinovorans]UKF04060.1 hypothetical protein JMY29_00180 [Paenarthrobacter nicotinovorans]GGV40006.1 hypothetical protein GCM10010212_30740 [Paenarthrobacter nicotinovorans]